MGFGDGKSTFATEKATEPAVTQGTASLPTVCT